MIIYETMINAKEGVSFNMMQQDFVCLIKKNDRMNNERSLQCKPSCSYKSENPGIIS